MTAKLNFVENLSRDLDRAVREINTHMRRKRGLGWRLAPAWALSLRNMLEIAIHNQEVTLAKLDDVLAAVRAEKTLIDSVGALVTGLRDKLAAALANTALPADVQAEIDTIFTEASSNRDALAAAITEPAAPAPAPAPAPEPAPAPVDAAPAPAEAPTPVDAAPAATDPAPAADPAPAPAADPAPATDPAATDPASTPTP